jgi:hypothetical protein
MCVPPVWAFWSVNRFLHHGKFAHLTARYSLNAIAGPGCGSAIQERVLFVAA